MSQILEQQGLPTETRPMTEVKKGRGRPKGSTNKTKAAKPEKFPEPQAENEAVRPGSNKPKAPKGPTVKPQVAKEPLNDEQEHALTQHHSEKYKKLLELKKTAAANLKNGCKLAKAEGVSLKQIKEYIDYQTEEGQERLREDLARKQKVARWAGLPVGTQINFLEEIDRTPIDERTREDGKRAGLKGEKCEAPRHVPGNLISAWVEGWTAGQAVLAARITQQKDEDSREFDDELPAGGEEDEDEAA